MERRLGDRISLELANTDYKYNFDSLILKQPKEVVTHNESNELLFEQSVGFYHECFHWIQHHGTTIGALLSLIRYSQEETTLRHFRHIPDNIKSKLLLKRKNQRIIPVDESTFDLPIFENEQGFVESFFRIWHDHLLVYTMLLDSDLQDNIEWPRATSFSEIIADSLIVCDKLGIIKYPGNSIARDAYLPIDVPYFIKCPDGNRLVTRSIIEFSAVFNEYMFIKKMVEYNPKLNKEKDAILNRLKEGFTGSIVELFLQNTPIEFHEIELWLPSITAICDISLNPPIPPMVINLDKRLYWGDIYPPVRFYNLIKALNEVGKLEYNTSKEELLCYVSRICNVAGIDNPSEYNYSIDLDSQFDINSVDEGELYNLIADKSFNYYSYIQWVQNKFFRIRTDNPSFFIDFTQTFLQKLDSGNLVWFNGLNGKDVKRWIMPQFIWTDEDISIHESTSEINNNWRSILLYERTKYYALFDFIFNKEGDELQNYPSNTRKLLLKEVMKWINLNTN